MKTKVVPFATLFSVVAIAGFIYSANADKKYELERAIRLQTLSNIALNNGNYELACRAQQEVTDSVSRAGVIDVIEQVDIVESEICSLAWTTTISAMN